MALLGWSPPRLKSGTDGAAGNAVSGGTMPYDPTAGRQGDTAGAVGRRKRNTMRNTHMGGSKIRPYRPEELAREALTYAGAPRIMPPAGRKFRAPSPARRPEETHPRSSRKVTGTLSETEALRQRAMTDRSVLTTTGAVRNVPGAGPVWASGVSG
jgi:hypothetical protein